MTLKRIRLELARSKQYPEGSRAHGYEFVLPLTSDGHIDAVAWSPLRASCHVRRFWEGEPDKRGDVHHTRHRTWAFSYEPGEVDDEHFYRLDTHVFRVGEYVTIAEPSGESHTYKVVRVKDEAHV